MKGPSRIAAFAALLVAVFAGSALLGGAVEPASSEVADGHGADHGESAPATSGEHEDTEHAEDVETDAAAIPPGLQIASDGYRLDLERSRLPRGERTQFAFRILDEGAAVREFELEHERRMHFIVVRRDLSGFQHLHPTMRPDGTWTTRLALRSGGVYRVFADFKAEGAKRTLGADVQVAGPYRPEKLPRSGSSTRTEDGLEVSLRSQGAVADEEGRVEFEVRDDGGIVNDRLEPYLGAAGHLVALRGGDLAYLHTHPEGDELAFMADYPSAGSYRLFVQFRYEGSIQTAAFTQEVEE